ncbi:MAG: DMT family transporter [Myxococcota bacterium]
MAAAAFFFSIMSLLVRVAGERLPPSMLVLARAGVALVLAFLMVRRAGLNPWGNARTLLVVRGLLGFAALSCYYYSLTHLPLAEATVIQYTNPVFTGLLAALLLEERLRSVEFISVVVSLVGVVLVARPTFLFGAGAAHLDPVATGFALAGAVFSAFAYVAVRKSSGKDHPLVVVLWFPLIATPLSVPLAVKQWVWPTPLEWVLLVGIGVATQAAQVFMTEGLHREPAGRATAMSYLQVAFAVAWGVAVLREVPEWHTLAGALLIGASVVGLALWKRPEDAAAAPTHPAA